MTPREKLLVIARMLEYVEAHLSEPITLADLSRTSGYSPWYAARLFKEQVGKTPFEYIRTRRLTAAAERLAEGPARVIDVAFDFDFDSHDGFTRAFTRQFGLTPVEYRRRLPKLDLYFPPLVVFPPQMESPMTEPIKQNKTSLTVFVQIVDRPARKLIVKRGVRATNYYEYCEEVGCDVWEKLGRIEKAIHEPMGLWLPDNLRPEGTSTYAQGVEVTTDYAGHVPDGFDVVALAPCKMMVFQGPPFEDADFEAAIGALGDAIAGYKPEVYGYAWADSEAPRFQLEPVGYRGYIEGRPVRPLNAPRAA